MRLPIRQRILLQMNDTKKLSFGFKILINLIKSKIIRFKDFFKFIFLIQKLIRHFKGQNHIFLTV